MSAHRGKKRARIRVGDTVAWDVAGRTARARVIADRGNLGIGGRQLVRVSVEIGEGAPPDEFELPEELLRIVRRAPRRTTRRAA